MAELADALRSGRSGSNPVGVQIPPPVYFKSRKSFDLRLFCCLKACSCTIEYHSIWKEHKFFRLAHDKTADENAFLFQSIFVAAWFVPRMF